MSTCGICGKIIPNTKNQKYCKSIECQKAAKKERNRRCRKKKRRKQQNNPFDEYNNYIRENGEISYAKYQTLKREKKI